MKKCIVYLLLFVSLFTLAQNNPIQSWIDDKELNFYEVCRLSEEYFKNNGKGKGSGWKKYQRWKSLNESYYYPDGERGGVDYYKTSRAYSKIVEKKGLKTNSTSWEELGPYYIDNITRNYNAGIGRVEDFYVDPTNPLKMYMVSRSGGFWKTLDGGQNWNGGSTDFLPASGVNTITVNPTNSDEIFINVRNSVNKTTHGVYKSINGGVTWEETSFVPDVLGWGGLGTNARIEKIAFHPLDSNIIFVASKEGLYKSEDKLVSWEKVDDAFVYDIAFHPTDDNVIYIFSKQELKEVRRSNNKGDSFLHITLINENTRNNGHLSVSSACEDCLFFATTDGVWKSTDQGSSFTFLSNPDTGAGGFAVSDINTDDLMVGYIDLTASTDGGNTFEQVTNWHLGSDNHNASSFTEAYLNGKYIHADVQVAKSINGVFYVGTDGTFAKSEDQGVTWQILNQGTAIRENYRLGLSQSNAFKSISGSQDNGSSIKEESGWIEFYGADGMEGIIHPLNENWLIGSTQKGNRKRSKDGGVTQNGVNPSGQNADWNAPLAYDPNNHMTIYTFGEDVFKSNTYGGNWENRGTPSFTGSIIKAAIAENNSNIIVVSRSKNIEKSIDGGVTFNSIKNNLPNASITDIAFDPNDDDTIIVVYNKYQADGKKIYITRNGGNLWENITYGLDDIPMHSVVIDHTAETNIYVGGEMGVYRKTIDESSWSLFNANLPNATIKELEIQYGSNKLKAATWGRGLWEVKLNGRENYPSINNVYITDLPTEETPKEGIEQYVYAQINSVNTPINVHCKWSINEPVFDNTIAMSVENGDLWKTNSALPDVPYGTKVYFKIFVLDDNAQETETYKYMYTVKENSTLGIDNINVGSDLGIYPNPVGENLFITIKENIAVIRSIEIYDLVGKKVMSKRLKPIDSTQSIDVSMLSSGAYVLKIITVNSQQSLKIIKK